MKKVKCDLCGFDIDTHQIKKHKKAVMDQDQKEKEKVEGKDGLKEKHMKNYLGEKKHQKLRKKFLIIQILLEDVQILKKKKKEGGKLLQL